MRNLVIDQGVEIFFGEGFQALDLFWGICLISYKAGRPEGREAKQLIAHSL